MTARREAILAHALSTYNTRPEYLWLRFPGYAVLRHAEGGRWYAILMDVPRRRLGLPGEGRLDILNVKCDPVWMGSLLGTEGFLPAYHMNKASWVSVRLDGAVPLEEIYNLLALSFALTARKR